MQKKSAQKLCMCYFGMGSKKVSNSSPVFTSFNFNNGQSNTLFQNYAKSAVILDKVNQILIDFDEK
jgi:hypothetical protein